MLRRLNAVLALYSTLCVACSAPVQGSPTPDPVAATPASVARPDGVSTTDTRMLEQPAISAEHIAFVYASDLWVARLDGSNVRRLTSHPGLELRPRFSPDGKWLAFSGQYDGNLDVYLVPVAGGEPQRLTWHPGDDVVQGFTPDGASVAFLSQRDVYTRRFWHLFSVDVRGGFPKSYDLPTCSDVAFSPDGKQLAYNPLSDAFQQWKNYRGGRTSRIWIYSLDNRGVIEVPQPKGRSNDTDAAWLGGKLYFRSDRAGEFNLFAYDATSKAVTQLTQHADFPIQSLSSGGGKLVYEQAGWLHLFDPATGRSTRLVLGVAADLADTRPRFVKGAEYVRAADPSPSGARVAVAFRGEILTVPAEHGDPRNLTQTPGANERTPAWSPDGKTIAWFSDESGENRLVLAPQDGRGERRSLALEGAGFYFDPKWSPDSKKLSYVDNARSLYVLDVASGKATRIAADALYGVFPTMTHSWSPDSRWLAYDVMTKTGFRTIELHDVESGATQALTDGLSDATSPVFDASGKYLYLAASTDAGPFLTWFSQASSDIEQTNALYLVCLASDTPSPFAKQSDEEELAAAKPSDKPDAKPTEKADAKPTEGAPAKSEESAKSDEKQPDEPKGDEKQVAATRIDFEGLGQRIVALPLGSGFYTGLRAGDAGQLFYLKAERAAFGGSGDTSELSRFDLDARKEKSLLSGVQSFVLTHDHKKVLFTTEGGAWLTALGDSLDQTKGKLAYDALEVKLEPRAEWRQIFDEAWRINRDYFYDPKMHGADWPAMKARYAQFLPHLATRSDLNRVIMWLCSELGVGHSRGGGGDTLVDAETVPGGLLGADYELADGRYRFKKVFGGLNWTPELRAPLTEPGVGVKAGEYLLAVQGRDLTARDNLYARFENSAGKQLELTVGRNADGAGSRTVKVVPIADEGSLRNRDWVEGNIAKVTKATEGKVAYVYVPNTAELGFEYFKRYFFPQSDRQAIIVDERHNGGGSVADYYIDILRRPYVSNWATRYGASFATPQAAIFGPKVMLIDETAGSGGDLLPWMFRKFELGKLIGRRTWGGLVGILGFPELMDGGEVTAPNIGFWTEEEGFGVENVGVPPDIEVEQLPALVQAGRDPQLERAIEEILAELKANPPSAPIQPPFPVRVRK